MNHILEAIKQIERDVEIVERHIEGHYSKEEILKIKKAISELKKLNS